MALTGNHVPGDPGHASDHNLIDQAFLPWTSFTPTLTGTGWALGNSTLDCQFKQIGKIVHVRYAVTFGSTATFGSVSPALSLPVVGVTNADTFPGRVVDLAANRYLVFWNRNAPSLVGLVEDPATHLLNPLTATAPITLAAGFIFRVSGTYEAA